LSGQETVIYDWTSFVSAVANDAPKDWDPQIKVEGTPGTALGSQWRASYQQMPTSSSQCRNVSDQDVEITVESVGKAQVATGSAMVEVETVTLTMRGNWSACQYSGTWRAKRVLAPEQQLLLSNEFESLLSSGQTVANGKTTLLRVEPAPAR
jgi:hypothetical protein